MKRTSIKVTIGLFLGLGLTLVSLWLLGGSSSVAQAQGPDGYSTYYVAPSCTGVPLPCYTTPQSAVDAADDPEDVIKVAAGTYTGVNHYGGLAQVVYVSKTVTVRGGYTTTNWTASNPDANHTTLDAQGQGRVFYIAGDPSAVSGQAISPTIEGLRITGGDATGLGGYPGPVGDAGGGVYVITATAIISDNRVFSNTADFGGGMYLSHSNSTLSVNTVASNTANSGGGLLIEYSTATLSSNIVISNVADYGAGVFLLGADATTVSGNTVASNTAEFGGGGLFLNASEAMLSENTVSANREGGLFLFESDALLVNNLLVGNRDNWEGGSLYIKGGSSRLVHTTFVRSSGRSGIYVTEGWWTSSTVALTNTILVSHTVGITVTPGNTATLEATLWGGGTWANDMDWGGTGTIVTGTHNYWGDPVFVNPDAGDYHIGPGSAALDRGVDAGVTVDIDGDSRPVGAGYDLGADEFPTAVSTENFLYLPLVLRQSS
jgi:parallel beta-helix repeat protein